MIPIFSTLHLCCRNTFQNLTRAAAAAGRPEAGHGDVAAGDAFLLCSAGFWEYVYNEEILAELCKAHTPKEWAEGMLLRHIRRTPPGNDNFSLIAVFVEECG